MYEGIVGENVARQVPKIEEQTKQVEIIAIEDARKLFKVLEEHYPHLVPFNALRAFGGIRTAHAKTMTWEQINFVEKGIRFDGGGKRVYSFLEGYPDNLWVWLEKYRSYEFKLTHARETGKIMSAHGIECPHNGLRHGFGTYHLGEFRDINLTAILMMHRGNPRMLYDHYRGVTSRSASSQFFEILPESER